jgi:glycosyltransferase involved in cell wall biosynthesis
MSPSLSVVIPSLNGAAGVRRCLSALADQTISSALEVIVVDDGSTDATSDVAGALGAVVVRHAANRGVSAARNSGIAIASAPVIAFLDDDCAPDPRWAEQILAGYTESTVAVGGAVSAAPCPGIMTDYLRRHNPFLPQELELAKSSNIAYRFLLYMRRLYGRDTPDLRRPVISMASANLSARREALAAVGGFDERIRFGSEDEDLCRRLVLAHPGHELVYEPAAAVRHYFSPSLLATMARSRAYGQGSATMYRKWPDVRPTFFPFPVFILATVAVSFWLPVSLVAAVGLPHVFYPQGIRDAVRGNGAHCLFDPYLQLLQEACDDYGFVQGWWRFRGHFDVHAPHDSVVAYDGGE